MNKSLGQSTEVWNRQAWKHDILFCAGGADGERPRLERLDAEDFVIAGIAVDYQPSLAGAVIPKLAMGPGWVVAKVDVSREALQRVRRLRVGALHTGVLLVNGDRSAPVFHAITAELARCLQNDSTATIPGADHAMHATNPAYYNQVVLRYLATH